MVEPASPDTPDSPTLERQLTEKEARIIGYAAQRIAVLRAALQTAVTRGSLTIQDGSSTQSIALGRQELQSALAWLIEVHGTTLASYGVQLEEPMK